MQIKNKAIKKLILPGVKVGIAIARFNSEITEKMLVSAMTALQEAGVKEKNIRLVEVPGCIEIPVALNRLAKSKKFDCLVALGCVIRGETPHFDYVCKMVQEGILRVMMDYNLPVGFGIVTVNNLDQAQVRTELGADAVHAALEVSQIK